MDGLQLVGIPYCVHDIYEGYKSLPARTLKGDRQSIYLCFSQEMRHQFSVCISYGEESYSMYF